MIFNYRDKFSIFKQKNDFIYFDSACLTLLPQCVLESINKYYLEYSGCHGRGGHFFGDETSKHFQEARVKIQKFINAKSPDEIIFTKNTTEGINLIANTFPFKSGDIVLTSDIEHNSNLLPWQEISRKNKVKHVIFSTSLDTTFDINKFVECMNENIRLASLLHISNLTGILFPIDEISKIAHKFGAFLLIDAAQSLTSQKIDVQKMGIDFLVSSMHKNFGPNGVGFIYGRRDLLEKLDNFVVGGETIVDATFKQCELAPIPQRFEPGLQNYAGVIGSGAAIDFINEIGIETIHDHKIKLNNYLSEELKKIPGIVILGPESGAQREGICNFIINNIDVFEVVKILSRSQKIMIRPGFHCVHAWFHKNMTPASLRVSFQIYNTLKEIDIFVDSIKKITKYFK